MPFLSTSTIPHLSGTSPFETARRKLIASLLAMKAPGAYPNYPIPSDHEGIANHIREAAKIFDEWLSAVGHQVRDNTTTDIDDNLFNGSFTGAIEGNETWALENEGIELREFRQAQRRAS